MGRYGTPGQIAVKTALGKRSVGCAMRREGLAHSSSWWQSQLQSWQQRTCTPASQGVAGLVGSVITGLLLVIVVERQTQRSCVVAHTPHNRNAVP